MAEACNIGLKPLIKQNIPALTRHRLNWIKQNYLRSETIVRANNRLVAINPHYLWQKNGVVEM